MISINPTSFSLGALFGTGVGVFSTRRFLKEKLRAEVMAEAQAEVDSMREHFEKKEVALLERMQKMSPEEIVENLGYESHSEPGSDVRVLRPPVPVDEPLASRKAPSSGTPTVVYGGSGGQEGSETTQHVYFPPAADHWDWKNEMLTRTAAAPYIIHHTEASELSGYEEVSYEYYPVDNVLVDEDGQKIEDVEGTVGPLALDNFGHGSEDANVVYVRNPHLQLHIEIQRLPGRSYAVDVLGLSDDQAS